MAHRDASGGPDGGNRSPRWVKIVFWILVAALISAIIFVTSSGIHTVK
jgi:hypothetical protein